MLDELVKAEALKRNLTIKGLSEVMGFQLSTFYNYKLYSRMPVKAYLKFKEQFPTFIDHKMEQEIRDKNTIKATVPRITKRQEAIELVEWILKEHDRTILPQYFTNKQAELVKEMKDRGINIECYKVISKGRDYLDNDRGSKIEQNWYVRRI